MKTVLLVDDEPDIVETLQLVLELELGLVVRTAPSGEAALDMLAQAPVDLIISDYKMRGMDGLAFLELARARVPSARRVLITAYPEGDIAFRALKDAGVVGLITKPCKTSQVVRAVAEALGLPADAGAGPPGAQVSAPPRGWPAGPRSAGSPGAGGAAGSR